MITTSCRAKEKKAGESCRIGMIQFMKSGPFTVISADTYMYERTRSALYVSMSGRTSWACRLLNLTAPSCFNSRTEGASQDRLQDLQSVWMVTPAGRSAL